MTLFFRLFSSIIRFETNSMALCTHYCDYQLLIWMHHSAGFSCQLSRLLRRRTIKLVGPLHCRVRYKLYILTVAFYWRQLNLTFYQSSCSAITITHLQSCNLGTAHIILTMCRPVVVLRYAGLQMSSTALQQPALFCQLLWNVCESSSETVRQAMF